MPRPRVLTPADVRVSASGAVTAAPAWAYRPGPGGRPEADPAAWAPLLAQLARWYGPGSRLFRRTARERAAYEARPLRAGAPRRCCVCGRRFYYSTHAPGWYCSRRCNHRRPRLPRRESRAKDPDTRTRACARCGATFTPARSDARYCSARCRVAAHRAGG
jgi:hypothetical protein